MLSGILNPFGADRQMTNAVFYACMGLLAGRKFCLAIGYKLGEDLVGKQNAEQWRQAGNDYMAEAKKNVYRDVAAVAGIIGVVLLTSYTEKTFRVKKEEPKPEQPGYFKSYAIPLMEYGAGLGILAGAILKIGEAIKTKESVLKFRTLTGKDRV